MTGRRALLAAMLLLAPATVAARDLVGVYGSWGAFREPTGAQRGCFAIAQPVVAGGRAGWRPFASVGFWPNKRLRGSLHVRLSAARDRSAGVTLTIGERRFALVAAGSDAWAADAPSDRAIVAAIRGGRSMSVEAVGAGGRPFADSYALGGAPTAIDAAALACVGK